MERVSETIFDISTIGTYLLRGTCAYQKVQNKNLQTNSNLFVDGLSSANTHYYIKNITQGNNYLYKSVVSAIRINDATYYPNEEQTLRREYFNLPRQKGVRL